MAGNYKSASIFKSLIDTGVVSNQDSSAVMQTFADTALVNPYKG